MRKSSESIIRAISITKYLQVLRKHRGPRCRHINNHRHHDSSPKPPGGFNRPPSSFPSNHPDNLEKEKKKKEKRKRERFARLLRHIAVRADCVISAKNFNDLP